MVHLSCWSGRRPDPHGARHFRPPGPLCRSRIALCRVFAVVHGATQTREDAFGDPKVALAREPLGHYLVCKMLLLQWGGRERHRRPPAAHLRSLSCVVRPAHATRLDTQTYACRLKYAAPVMCALNGAQRRWRAHPSRAAAGCLDIIANRKAAVGAALVAWPCKNRCVMTPFCTGAWTPTASVRPRARRRTASATRGGGSCAACGSSSMLKSSAPGDAGGRPEKAPRGALMRASIGASTTCGDNVRIANGLTLLVGGTTCPKPPQLSSSHEAGQLQLQDVGCSRLRTTTC